MKNTAGLGHCALSINATPLNFAPGIFVEAILQSGYPHKFPVGEFTLRDSNGILTDSLALVDGAVLDIELGPDQENARQYSFRVFNVHKWNETNATMYKVSAYLNRPSLVMGAHRDMLVGNVSWVLGELALLTRMKYKSYAESDDSMTWLNVGETRANFLQSMVEHSYISDAACPSAVVDFDYIYYADLFDLLKQDAAYTILANSPPPENLAEVILAEEVRPLSNSGLMNALANYGVVQKQHRLDGSIEDYDSIEVPMDGGGLPVSAEVASEIEGSQLNFGGFYDVGADPLPGSNLHERYYATKYANTRKLAMFSESQRVLTRHLVDAPLFSVVDMNSANVQGGQPNRNYSDSGKYIIGGKTLVVRRNHYAEIYDIYRHYVGAAGNTPVVGTDAASQTNANIQTTNDAPKAIQNMEPTTFGSVADKVAAYNDQVNTKLSGPRKMAQERLDEATKTLDDLVTDAESWMKKQGEKFFTPEVAAKYGAQADHLDSVLNEIQSAKKRLDGCGPLGDLENFVVDRFMPEADGLLSALYTRADYLDGQISKGNKFLNKLVGAGAIDAQYLDEPKVRMKCADWAQDALKDLADKNLLPDKCVDRMAFDKFNLPLTKLGQMLRIVED